MPLSDPTLIINIRPSVQRVLERKAAPLLFREKIPLIISGTKTSFISLFVTPFRAERPNISQYNKWFAEKCF